MISVRTRGRTQASMRSISGCLTTSFQSQNAMGMPCSRASGSAVSRCAVQIATTS
jgi:hypothetical protein